MRKLVLGVNLTGLFGGAALVAAAEADGCCDSDGFENIEGSGGNRERDPAGAGWTKGSEAAAG